HFLYRVIDELLDVEAVGDELGFGEAAAYNLLHTGGHIECLFGNLLPFSSGKLPEYGAHFLTVGPLYHRHQAAFLPPCSLVGHYRVKLTLRQRALVDAKMGP